MCGRKKYFLIKPFIFSKILSVHFSVEYRKYNRNANGFHNFGIFDTICMQEVWKIKISSTKKERSAGKLQIVITKI